MMHPYDTGERAQPHDWVQVRAQADEPLQREDIGKVDFDNDSGGTVATVWVERDETGSYVIVIERHDDGTTVRMES